MSLSKIKILLIIIFTVVALGILGLLLFLQKGGLKKEGPANFPTPTITLANESLAKPIFKSAEGVVFDKSIPVTFNLPTNFSLPKKAPKIIISRALAQSSINFLANAFSFSGQPKELENSLLWTEENGTKSLLVVPNSGFIQYSNSQTVPEGPTRLSLEELAAIAQTEIKKLSITNTEMVPSETNGYTAGGEDRLPQSSSDKATLYELSYTQSASGIPIFYQLGSPARVSLWIDVYGNIKKMEYFNLQLKEADQLSLPSLENIKKLTEEGNATIVRLGEFESSFPSIQTITITNVSLAYFDDKTGSLLSPIFVLTGKAAVLDRLEDITLYLSAI